MWIGRFLAVVIAVGVLFSCATPNDQKVEHPAKPEYAWWLTHEFNPKEQTSLNNKKQFSYIRLLTQESLKNIPGAVKDWESSNLAFKATADLNNDGVSETFSSGVYQDINGKTGILIVITQEGELLEILRHEGKPMFNALYQENDQLLWFDCIQCDNYETIKWSESGYYLW